jgi:hypothetical protein
MDFSLLVPLSAFLHYAQIPFQNNQVLLLVILGYGCALVASLDQKPLFALLGGLCLGLAILIRVSSILHVLTVSLFFITYLFYKYRHRKIIFKYGLIWLGGFLPLFLLGRVLDYIRYGSPWMTGQRLWVKQIHNHPFWSNLPEFPENWPILSDSIGIWGALFSPAKSIFIYDPLLLPCLILGIVFWKRFLPEIKLYLLSVLLNLGLHIAVTSYLDFWHGDSAWAARYHVTSVHLILLPLIPVLIEFMFRSRGFKNWIIKTIIFLSIIIQSLSIILSFALEDAQGYLLPPERRYLEFRLGQRIVNVVCKVNSSISDSCITEKIAKLSEIQDTTLGRTLKRIDYHNRIVLLPFNYARYRWNRRWTFIIWSVMLLLAISMTIHLWKSVSLE